MLVESAPVPPHERPWRHPSELAPTRVDLDPAVTAPPRSPLPLLAGTLAAVVVVVLVVAMTPTGRDAGSAVSMTTMPAFSTSPAAVAGVPEAAAGTGDTGGSFGFASLVAIPRRAVTTPAVDDGAVRTVDDTAVVFIVTDEAIYRTRWHELRRHADPRWLAPLGDAIVITGDGHLLAEVTGGELTLAGG